MSTAFDEIAPVDLGRENGSSVFLAGRVLEEVAKRLIAVGQAALGGTDTCGRPVLAINDRQSGYLGPHRLGSVQMFPGKVTVELPPDHPALVAWALNNPRHRHNVLTYQMLAPASVDQIKAHAKKVGAPVDEHGDIVPGLTIRTGEPTPTKDLDKGLMVDLLAPERINQLVHSLLSGAASLPGLPALQPPEGDDQ